MLDCTVDVSIGIRIMNQLRWAAPLSLLSVIIIAGCGASPGASRRPMSYRYGDMFVGEDEEEYAGSPAMARASRPPPAPAPAAPAPEYARAQPTSGVVEEQEVGAGGGGYEGMAEAEAYDDEVALPSDDGAPGEPPQVQTAPSTPQEPPVEPSEPEPVETGADQEPAPEAEPSRRAPLLIYQAAVRLAVREIREKIDEVLALTHTVGGYVLRQDDTSVVIRVPAARFRETLDRIETLGDVVDLDISAQDVTDQVRALRIRLRNAVQMRDRLVELLAQAQTVPESLIIERELERLNETIQLLRGTLRALEEQVAFSTITVRFEPVREDREVPRERFRLPFPWLDHLGLPNLMQFSRRD